MEVGKERQRMKERRRRRRRQRQREERPERDQRDICEPAKGFWGNFESLTREIRGAKSTERRQEKLSGTADGRGGKTKKNQWQFPR